MHRWSAVRNKILILLLVVLALLAIRTTKAGKGPFNALSGAMRYVLVPLEGSVNWVSGQVYDLTAYPLQLIGAANRNKMLEQEVENLQNQVVSLKEYKSEAETLQKILDYHPVDESGYHKIVAGVVSRNPDNWFGTLIINRGTDQGVRPDMPVVTPVGLVGRVLSVSRDSAEVLLISDPNSGVGAMVQETRVPGILEGISGGSGVVKLANIPLVQNVVSAGQVVVTSGIGSIYPKGIPIGVITSVVNEPGGLFRTAMVKPYVDLSRLEEVIVLAR